MMGLGVLFIRALGRAAAVVGGAAQVGGMGLALGCVSGAPPAQQPTLATAVEPSLEERYCAWYGDARDEILYFGQAAFWSAFRTRGDASADMALPGPQLVGRFDLARGEMLPPLDVGTPGARSGVWDVHAHDNGRIYYTTFFEGMGWVDPATGAAKRLEALGSGLNEIAPGPDGTLLVSRYASHDGGDGSVLVITPSGERVAEHRVPAPAGFISAPKTVAFDPRRREIWVTSDLLPLEGGEPRHDSYVLDENGRVLRRFESPEVQFVAFTPDGTGWRVEAEPGRLWLARVTPDGTRARILLDGGFPQALDFAQDVKPTADGGVVVTRWSGRLHVVDGSGRVQDHRLPAIEPGGLYYTGVVAGGRLCSTYCAGVTVVCSAPR